MGPMTWLALAGWIAVAGTYGYMKIQEIRHVSAALEDGKKQGAASVAAATTLKSTKTVELADEGRVDSSDPVPADKAALIERCKRSASCRARGSLQ